MSNLRVKKLICVEIDNKKTGVSQSNKFYNMYELGNGKFKVEYGRVGKTKIEKFYSMSDWNKILRSKLKKYDDVTHLHEEDIIDDSNTYKSNTPEDELISMLQIYASNSVKKNYKISSKKVTQKMIDEAQKTLNSVVPLIVKNGNKEKVNDYLLTLYKIIPRQMDNVKNYLVKNLITTKEIEIARKLIENEQDTLDTMAGQVSLNSKTEDKQEKETSLIEALGLEIKKVSDRIELDKISSILDGSKNKLKNAYKVRNKETYKKFKKDLEKAKNKETDLFLHGSRNQNWFNILQTGLLIRPAGAIHTGSMFGDGIYGANKAQKAIGYSSLRGSYWTQGSDSKGFIAIFSFRIGKQKHVHKHTSECYSFNKSKINKEGYDSVFAHSGIDLRNDEFVIYDSSQCTIEYLLELE